MAPRPTDSIPDSQAATTDSVDSGPAVESPAGRAAGKLTTEFQDDLSAAQEALQEARAELLEVLQPLRDSDLDRVRRGSWSVRATLDHLLGAEWHYVDTVMRLRDQPRGAARDALDLTSVRSSLAELERARRALTAAAEGVDEETFYRLGQSASQEYSVLSALENAADHDREHTRQIARLVQA